MAGTATQQDVFHLRADVATLQRSVQQTRTEVDALSRQLDGRLQAVIPEAEPAAALSRRLDELATTVAALSRDMDAMNARLESLNRQLRATAPAPPAPATPAAPPGPRPGARPATGALQPEDIYQAAYIDFSKGTYQLAVESFREFLRRYPGHDRADHAQYWIGESHVGLARQYGNAGERDKAAQALRQAVQEFRKVIANYPRRDKAPTALYQEALVLIELEQADLAQARLQYLVENFPQAEETRLARERLAALRER
jgi:tol-pal system protein YbgF